MDRSKLLHDIRPFVKHHSDLADLNSPEGFQNNVLRPILKLQNDWIMRIVTGHLVNYQKVALQKIDPKDLSHKVETLISRNQKLRNTLLGGIIGLLTGQETEIYFEYEDELKRRIFTMLHQRIMDNFTRNIKRNQAAGIPVF